MMYAPSKPTVDRTIELRKPRDCETLAELLEIALFDIRRVEQMPDRFNIAMDVWACNCDDICDVCFAGSVLVMRVTDNIPLDEGEDYSPGPANEKWMFTLDRLRRGYVNDACEVFYGKRSFAAQALNRHVQHYHHDPEAWHRDMGELLVDLREAGL